MDNDTGNEIPTIDYTILRNDVVFTTGSVTVLGPVNVTVIVDGLLVGVYTFEIEFENPGPAGGWVTDSVIVRVLPNSLPYTLSIGLGIGAIVVIIAIRISKRKSILIRSGIKKI